MSWSFPTGPQNDVFHHDAQQDAGGWSSLWQNAPESRPADRLGRAEGWLAQLVLAPTYRAAKSIAWRQLKAMVPKELFADKNEVDLSIELINGAELS